MLRTVLLIILITLLTACTLPSSPAEYQSSTQPAVPLTETPGFASTPIPVTNTPGVAISVPSATPTSPVQNDLLRTQYTLQAELDYWNHTLVVSETIAFINSSPDILDELWLEVEANRWAGGFVLLSLRWDGGEDIANYELSSNQMVIPLLQPLQPGEEILLLIDYQLFLPAIPDPSDTSRPMPFGYTERQTNLVDWYPSVPPYRSGEGWLLHKPGYFGEHQVYEVADFDVQITLSQPVKDLVIAASAPADERGESYHYYFENARNFAWSASHMYNVQSATVGGVLVSSYSFPTDTWADEQAFQDTVQAVRLYSELFSPYPYPSLSLVEADFLDGMEFSGLYFLSRGFYNLYDGTPKGYLTAIAVHETAHQWWYSQVGNDQALEPWLDEAMCTYSERLFYENTYPDLVDWWWAFRVDYYEPSGVIDGTIYDYGGFMSYRDSVYLHGAQFIEELRNAIGDDAFFAFLRDYVSRNANRQVTGDDFFNVLQEHSDQDLSRLRNKYFTPKE